MLNRENAKLEIKKANRKMWLDFLLSMMNKYYPAEYIWTPNPPNHLIRENTLRFKP